MKLFSFFIILIMKKNLQNVLYLIISIIIFIWIYNFWKKLQIKNISEYVNHRENITDFFIWKSYDEQISSNLKRQDIINDILNYSKENFSFYLDELEKTKDKFYIDLLRDEINENFQVVWNFMKWNFNFENHNRYISHSKGWYFLKKDTKLEDFEQRKETWCMSFHSTEELQKCSIAKLMYSFFSENNQFSKYWYIKVNFSDLNIEYFRTILENYINREDMFKLFLEARLEEINENILNNNSIF